MASHNFNTEDIETGRLISGAQSNENSYVTVSDVIHPHTRSFRRLWNQLSRLQRFIIIMLMFFVILCIVLLLPWTDSSFRVGVENYNKISAQQLDDKNFGNELSSNEKNNQISRNVIENFQAEDRVPKLEMKKVGFDGILLDRIVEAAAIKKGSSKERQKAVVDAFRHAWKGYKKHAWGHDHLKPITKTFNNWFGLGLTIVDSLDTMHIMGLVEELQEAKQWIQEKLILNVNKDVNFFETTIRVMGGLLSAFHLTQEPVFYEKAVDIANRLLPGFKSSSGIPFSDVNLLTGHSHPPTWSQDSSVSEVATIQLEFRDISRITGDPKYENAAFKVSEHLHSLPKKDGLIPMFINAETGKFRSHSTITVGARADSYYEYLLKQWLQTGKTINWLKEDYMEAVDGIIKNLVRKSYPNKLTFVGELLSGRSFSPKMDHLVCYLPGTLALGYHNGMPHSHMRLAFELMETCYNMYTSTATKLSPEIVYFNLQPGGKQDIIIKSNDAHNLLRPETVESLWYLYHFTRNETYRDWGWEIFQAFETYSKVSEGGYTCIGDVRNPLITKPRDLMESFFLAETLKYLYLLFSDNQDLYSLDRYIYNSEAHLLPIYES